MNKKAYVSFNIILAIPRAIFILIITLAILLLVRSFVVTEIDVKATEATLFMEEIMFSPNGISHKDVRTYPGTVDLDNFNDNTLKFAFNYSIDRNEPPQLAANLTLFKLQGNTLVPVKTIFYNERWYKIWNVMAGLSGASGSRDFMSTKYVLIYSKTPTGEEKIEPGILKMRVLALNK